MEFLDEETRPKLFFQSRPTPQSPPPPSSPSPKPTIFISLSLSALLFSLSLLHFTSDPLHSLLLWFSLSLLLGPFAPPSLTAGDIRVGQGPALRPPPPPPQDPDPPKRSRFNPKKPDQDPTFPPVLDPNVKKTQNPGQKIDKNVILVVEEDKEWSETDLELLKKQMAKYPAGMPGRWEAAAAAFAGRHRVESVVKMAKSMGEKKVGDSDSFSKFLKDRKPMDKRVDDAIEKDINGGSWSSAEDIALLNALKAFPKDTAMRWEKITAAVPMRSKSACMKRVSDLKRDFRSTKGASEA